MSSRVLCTFTSSYRVIRHGGASDLAGGLSSRYCINKTPGLFGLRIVRQIQNTFHKRPLPPSLVALSSPQGKLIFRQALELGGMECFFPLSEQFITQSEPSFCSISSLAMVLNALNHDPKKVWKAPWRWVSEETLQCDTMEVCGHSLEKVRSIGLSFREFESLAGCHGVNIRSYPVDKDNNNINIDSSDSSDNIKGNNNNIINNNDNKIASGGIDSFRRLVNTLSSNPISDTFAVVNFCRQRLGQTGSGHFSPIGGYNPQLDLVLVMDVARFKYPPFWVPLKALWEAMEERDPATGGCRGYFVISNQPMEVTKGQSKNHAHSHDHSHSQSHDHNHSHSHDHNHIDNKDGHNKAHVHKP